MTGTTGYPAFATLDATVATHARSMAGRQRESRFDG